MKAISMFVIVNGKTYPLPEPRTLAALLSSLSPSTPFAVARNEELVARVTYDECRIGPGNRIDIVHPTAGG
jgi:sulfur carrier protein